MKYFYPIFFYRTLSYAILLALFGFLTPFNSFSQNNIANFQFNDACGTELQNAVDSVTCTSPFTGVTPSNLTNGTGQLSVTTECTNRFRNACLSCSHNAGSFAVQWTLDSFDLSNGATSGANVGFGIRNCASTDVLLTRFHYNGCNIQLQDRTCGTTTLKTYAGNNLTTKQVVRGIVNLDNNTAEMFVNGEWLTTICIPNQCISKLRHISNNSNFAACDEALVGSFNLTENTVWTNDGGSNWNNCASWSNGVPCGVDVTAVFGNANTTCRSPQVNVCVTLGHITFDSCNSWNLTGCGTITMDVSEGNASIYSGRTNGAGACAGAAHKITNDIVLNDNLIATNQASGNLTFEGVISGCGGIEKYGVGNGCISVGNVTLDGNNTYTGTTIIHEGVLKLGHSNALGATCGGTVIQGGSVFIANCVNVPAGESLIIRNNPCNCSSSVLRTTGNINTCVSWGGPITIENGSQDIRSGSNSDNLLTLSGNMTINCGATVNFNACNAASTLLVSGDISGGGSFTTYKDGVCGVTAGTDMVRLSGNNSFSGAVSVCLGELSIEHVNALGDTGASTTTTVSSGATLSLNIAGCSTIDNENLVLSGSGFGCRGALAVLDGDITVSGCVDLVDATTIAINPGDSLTLNTITESGAGNTSLTIDGGGTLSIGGNNLVADSIDIILDGATLATNGFDETFGNLTLTANSVIDMSGGDSVLNFDNINLNGFTLEVHNWNGQYSGAGSDQLIALGTVTAGGGNIIFYSDSGSSAWGASYKHGAPLNALEVIPAPETSNIIICISLVFMCLIKFTQRRKSTIKEHLCS